MCLASMLRVIQRSLCTTAYFSNVHVSSIYLLTIIQLPMYGEEILYNLYTDIAENYCYWKYFAGESLHLCKGNVHWIHSLLCAVKGLATRALQFVSMTSAAAPAGPGEAAASSFGRKHRRGGGERTAGPGRVGAGEERFRFRPPRWAWTRGL